MSERERVAREIARDLFTNGNGQRAVRLVMETAGRPIDGGLGGWSERAVANRIADLLAALTPAPTPPAGVEARARQVVLHCAHTYPEYAKRRSGACAECIAKALRV